jgi:hypothetical protein
MDLTVSGKVVKVLEEQSGEGRNGPWRKQDFILETPGDYPKKICITQWGDNIDRNDVQQGDELTAHIDIQSREYKGRWYTDVKAWKIEKGETSSMPPSAENANGFDPMDLPEDDGDDALPF